MKQIIILTSREAGNLSNTYIFADNFVAVSSSTANSNSASNYSMAIYWENWQSFQLTAYPV